MPSMNDNQLLRYSRHILLDEIGIEGQQKLLDAHALVIGAGGLGSPVALYLASAGVGKITLVDNDTVDLTNLQRQILHSTESVGSAKAESGKQALARINPEVETVALQERAAGERLLELVGAADVVLDCSDNFATRHAVNHACVAQRKPATPACFRRNRSSKKCNARPWACSRRWSASSGPCRRLKH